MDRRTLLSTAAAAVSLAGARRDTFAQATPTPPDYVALTHAFFDHVLNPRDFSHAARYLSSNYRSINPADAPGPAAAIERLKAFFAAVDGYWNSPPIWTIDETIAQDTRVAVRSHLNGVRKEPFKSGALAFFGVLHFDGALISTDTLLFDRAAL